MILLIILLIPFITGLLLPFFRNTATVRTIALIATLINLVLTLTLPTTVPVSTYSAEWINFMGIPFSLGYDGISLVMVLLTNLLFPFIVMAGFGRDQRNVPMLNCLILCVQAALIGVFLAQNAFLFYVFNKFPTILGSNNNKVNYFP